MKKYLIILLVFILLSISACSSFDLFYIKNKNLQQITKEEYFSAHEGISVNIAEDLGILATNAWHDDENGVRVQQEQAETIENYYLFTFSLKGNGDENATYLVNLQIGMYVDDELVGKCNKTVKVNGNVEELFYLKKIVNSNGKFSCKVIKLDWN